MNRQLKMQGKIFNVDVADYDTKHWKVTFPYQYGAAWTALKDEIKAMRGSKFHKDNNVVFWTVDKCARNDWAFRYMDIEQESPYAKYDRVAPEIIPTRPMYAHQRAMLAHAHDKHQVILAAEMGTGKTLVVIELLEIVRPRFAWYIAPKFAIEAIKLEFSKWRASVRPLFLSYDQMKKVLSDWGDKPAPDFVIFDESAYIKTPGSQRSQYAQALTDSMRAEYADPFIILMSGAPAPKSPEDWWKQCEIACPGFIKEGHPITFKNRLALIIQEPSFAGGSYPKLVTWFDDEKKCKKCGMYADHPVHTTDPMIVHAHKFEPSTNEVAKLYERLKGLTYIIFKKDCLDLPDKVYREIALPIAAATKRAMNLIISSSPTTIEALTRCRELSDGFQYTTETSEEKFTTCKRCHGTGKTKEYEPEREVSCPNCDGSGTLGAEIRKANFADTPKDDALKDLLAECEETGRIVIYAGFTASVDRCVDICKKERWTTICVDGRGVITSEPMLNPLEAFQDKTRQIAKIAFIAHPATAKTALTLTESNMIVYYSNTFIGDDRIQSEDRIHRIGMDPNKGATIVDLLHLPTDKYVLDNLKRKRTLQSISLGELQKDINNAALQSSLDLAG